MDLSEYAESLRRELLAITRFAGEDVARAAEMLAETLDSSVRLALLDVLSAAADEITASLDGATIDVRLSGTQPEFVVNMTHAAEDSFAEATDATDEAGSTRITLRLSEGQKAGSRRPPSAPGCRSTPGWSARSAVPLTARPAAQSHDR